MGFSNEIKTVLRLEDKDWKKALSSIKRAEKEYYVESKNNTEDLIDKKEDLLRLEQNQATELKQVNKDIAKTEKDLATARRENDSDRIKSLKKILAEQKQERASVKASSKVEMDTARQSIREINNRIQAQERYNSVLARARTHFTELERVNLLAEQSSSNLTNSTQVLTTATQNQTRATTNLNERMSRALLLFGTVATSVYLLKAAYDSTLGSGIQMNRMIEDNTSGIAALLSANTQMVLSNGEMVSSMDKFQMGQKVAKETMDKLRKSSVDTYATFGQLTEIFQQAIGQTLSMGDSMGTTTKSIIDNTIQLSQRMSNIAGSIGMPMDRAKEEIRSLMSGNASTDSLIATMIFGSPTAANTAIREAKGRGTNGVKDMLDGMLEPFDVLSEVESYSRSLLALEDAWTSTMAAMSKPLFEDLTGLYRDMADSINENSEAITQGFHAIYEAGSNVVTFFGDLGDAIVYPLEKMAELKESMVFQSSGKTVGKDPLQIKAMLEDAKINLKNAKKELESENLAEKFIPGYKKSNASREKGAVSKAQQIVNKLQREYNKLLKEGVISEAELKKRVESKIKSKKDFVDEYTLLINDKTLDNSQYEERLNYLNKMTVTQYNLNKAQSDGEMMTKLNLDTTGMKEIRAFLDTEPTRLKTLYKLQETAAQELADKKSILNNNQHKDKKETIKLNEGINAIEKSILKIKDEISTIEEKAAKKKQAAVLKEFNDKNKIKKLDLEILNLTNELNGDEVKESDNIIKDIATLNDYYSLLKDEEKQKNTIKDILILQKKYEKELTKEKDAQIKAEQKLKDTKDKSLKTSIGLDVGNVKRDLDTDKNKIISDEEYSNAEDILDNLWIKADGIFNEETKKNIIDRIDDMYSSIEKAKYNSDEKIRKANEKALEDAKKAQQKTLKTDINLGIGNVKRDLDTDENEIISDEEYNKAMNKLLELSLASDNIVSLDTKKTITDRINDMFLDIDKAKDKSDLKKIKIDIEFNDSVFKKIEDSLSAINSLTSSVSTGSEEWDRNIQGVGNSAQNILDYSVQQYESNKDIEALNKKYNKTEEDFAESKIDNIKTASSYDKEAATIKNKAQQNEVQMYGNIAGSIAGMMEAGSDEQKAMLIAQQALAVTNAIASIANAGTNGDAYTAPARVAAMVSIMGSVLAMGGIAFGGGGSGGATPPKTASDYKTEIEDNFDPVIDRLDSMVGLLENIEQNGSSQRLNLESVGLEFRKDVALAGVELADKFTTVIDTSDKGEATKTFKDAGFDITGLSFGGIDELLRKQIDAIESNLDFSFFTNTGNYKGGSTTIGDSKKAGEFDDVRLNLEEMSEGLNFLKFSLASAKEETYTFFEGGIDGYNSAMEGMQITINDYASNVVDVANELKDASLDLQDMYDNLTDTNTYEQERVVTAKEDFTRTTGLQANDSNVTNYLKENIDKINEVTASFNEDVLDIILANDPSEALDRINDIEGLSDKLNSVYDGGAEEAINLIGSLGLMVESMANSNNNIKIWNDSLKTNDELLKQSADNLGVAIPTTTKEMNSLFETLKLGQGGFTDIEADFMQRVKESIDVKSEQIDAEDKATLSLQNQLDVLRKVKTQRDIELESLNSLDKAIKKDIWAIEDLNEVLDNRDILNDRLELLKATTDAEKLAITRTRELDELKSDENKNILKSIYAIEDAKTAEENRLQALEDSKKALEDAIELEKELANERREAFDGRLSLWQLEKKLEQEAQEEAQATRDTLIDALRDISDSFETMGDSISDTIDNLLQSETGADTQDFLIDKFIDTKNELDKLLALDGDLTEKQQQEMQDLVGDINTLSTDIQGSTIGDNSNITNELVDVLDNINNDISFENEDYLKKIWEALGGADAYLKSLPDDWSIIVPVIPDPADITVNVEAVDLSGYSNIQIAQIKKAFADGILTHTELDSLGLDEGQKTQFLADLGYLNPESTDSIARDSSLSALPTDWSIIVPVIPDPADITVNVPETVVNVPKSIIDMQDYTTAQVAQITAAFSDGILSKPELDSLGLSPEQKTQLIDDLGYLNPKVQTTDFIARDSTLDASLNQDLKYEDIYFGASGLSDLQTIQFAKLIETNNLDIAEATADIFRDLIGGAEMGDLQEAMETLDDAGKLTKDVIEDIGKNVGLLGPEFREQFDALSESNTSTYKEAYTEKKVVTAGYIDNLADDIVTAVGSTYTTNGLGNIVIDEATKLKILKQVVYGDEYTNEQLQGFIDNQAPGRSTRDYGDVQDFGYSSISFSEIGGTGEYILKADKTISTIYETIEHLASNIYNLGNLAPEVSAINNEIDGSHSTGLPYVPKDGYVAELHKGERVLTKDENMNYGNNINLTLEGNKDIIKAINNLDNRMGKIEVHTRNTAKLIDDVTVGRSLRVVSS